MQRREAAGALAAHCIETGSRAQQVRDDPDRLEEFQRRLVADGLVLAWPDEIRRQRR